MHRSLIAALVFVVACSGNASQSPGSATPAPAPAPTTPGPSDPAPTPAPDPTPATPAPTPTTPAPKDPAPTPAPTNPKTPKKEPPPADPAPTLPKMHEKCGANDACGPGLTCKSYYGIAGARGPQFKTCEIPCDKTTKCPAGTTCGIIADGPGQVCR
jgi:hypothetical protein